MSNSRSASFKLEIDDSVNSRRRTSNNDSINISIIENYETPPSSPTRRRISLAPQRRQSQESSNKKVRRLSSRSSNKSSHSNSDRKSVDLGKDQDGKRIFFPKVNRKDLSKSFLRRKKEEYEGKFFFKYFNRKIKIYFNWNQYKLKDNSIIWLILINYIIYFKFDIKSLKYCKQ